jgi:hypothetical protein
MISNRLHDPTHGYSGCCRYLLRPISEMVEVVFPQCTWSTKRLLSVQRHLNSRLQYGWRRTQIGRQAIQIRAGTFGYDKISDTAKTSAMSRPPFLCTITNHVRQVIALHPQASLAICHDSG